MTNGWVMAVLILAPCVSLDLFRQADHSGANTPKNDSYLSGSEGVMNRFKLSLFLNRFMHKWCGRPGT